jgi:hypothetical protein
MVVTFCFSYLKYVSELLLFCVEKLELVTEGKSTGAAGVGMITIENLTEFDKILFLSVNGVFVSKLLFFFQTLTISKTRFSQKSVAISSLNTRKVLSHLHGHYFPLFLMTLLYVLFSCIFTTKHVLRSTVLEQSSPFCSVFVIFV